MAPAATLRLSRVGGNKATDLARELGHEAFTIAKWHTLVFALKRYDAMFAIYGGLVASILAAEIAIDGVGIFTLGRIRSSLVMPFSIFVMPIMGASPFRTNS